MTNPMPSEQKEQWIIGDLLAAVMDDHSHADDVINALEAEGFARDTIRVFHGQAGSEEMGHAGGKGLIGHVLRGIEDWVGNSKNMTDHLKDEVDRGRYVLVVPLPDPDSEDHVRRVLQSHGGHDMTARINDNWKTYA
ncbi:MAG: hypothetical protein FJ320_07150 [SAR202 cluster bacterium]|nr:hypothetical protein [SAR202 cluster bacterium]